MGVVVRNPKPEELTTVWEILCGAFFEIEIDQIRIAEVDGKIVSHVWVAERPVFYRGQTVIPMGGIGGVGTLPEYRGRGLATLLLEDAIAYMERKGQPISMLFTGINPFYARLGWADFPEWRFRLQVKRVPKESETPERYSVRLCGLYKDLPELQSVYRNHVRGLQLSLCHARPDRFWSDGHLKYLGFKPSHVVVDGKGDGKIVGYACAFPTEQGIRVSEFAYDPSHPMAVVSLAIALAKEAKSEGKEGIVEGITPFMHPLPQILAKFTDATLSHQVTEHMMLRVNNLKACLEIASPVMERTLWEAKAESVNCSFCLALSQPEQKVTLEVRNGKVKVLESDCGALTLSVTPREFCLLFFGFVSAWQWRYLLAHKGTFLDDQQTALLDLLFPPHPSVYWAGDHF